LYKVKNIVWGTIQNNTVTIDNINAHANCRRLAMLNAFLRESDLQQVPNKTHKCCDICANKCGCGNCTFLPLETLFRSNKLEIADREESDSDATEPYDLSDIEGGN
jgi:hypothetical protein